MTELDQESKETSVQTNWTKVGLVALLILVVVVAGSSVGPALWRQLTREYRLRQSPEFTFTFSGVADQDAPVYEVTFDMFYARTPLGKFDVSISADYRGQGYDGPVDVAIRPAAGEPISIGRWDNFKNDHAKPLTFTLTERALFEYSAVPLTTSVVGLADGVVDTPSEGTFEVVVTAADGSHLAQKGVKVINTPWSHAAQLSDSLIGATQSITAYVTVRNIGAPAEFYVVGNLYDATSVSPDTIEQGEDGWSPGKSWGKPQVTFGELSPGTIAGGARFTVALPIASNQFQARHTYILETFALKHLPRLEFSPGDWRTSPESWRVRDNPTYMMIVVPAGME